ncbi:MAG TPA: hypothetical protein VJZ24_04105 [Thermodesulfovibrionales bacterium]|nr:hypothetical protein [Thermodesulfovibrionales bacterium]
MTIEENEKKAIYNDLCFIAGVLGVGTQLAKKKKCMIDYVFREAYSVVAKLMDMFGEDTDLSQSVKMYVKRRA